MEDMTSFIEPERRYKSCALVGNSMNLFDSASGPSIDAHDAVFRFNIEASPKKLANPSQFQVYTR